MNFSRVKTDRKRHLLKEPLSSRWHGAGKPNRLALEPLEDRRLLAVSISTLDGFEDGTTLGWSEGAGTSNPPTHVIDGGPSGAGDGFLRNVSGGSGAGSRQVMFNESGQWTGDYVSAGVTRIDAQLANFGASPLAMRIAIATGPLPGQSRTSWFASSDAVSLPPDGAWHTVSFSLASDSLSHVQGSNSLSTLLEDVTEIRILSNVSGPDFRGDRIAATLGADDIQAVGTANIAPEVSTTNADLSYQENQPATPIDSGLTVNDGDSITLTSATVSITGGFAPGEDVLEFANQLGIVVDVDAVNGMLTLTGTASVADYETALRSVTYANSSDSPSVAPRTITFLVDDGLAMGSAARNINVTATNDAPEINTTSVALNFSQHQGPTAVDSDLTVSDVDSVNLIEATVSIGADFAPGEDVLAFSNQLGITGDFAAATGVLTLSGSASVESYQTSLRSITYDNTSDTPNTSQRTISIQVNDGEDTTEASRDIIIAPSWHNFDNPFDVNGVDGPSPLDALLVINELNDRVFSDPTTGHLSVVGSPPPYLDVNNDGAVSPLDALLVINELPSTSRAPSAAGLPTSLASSFAVDRVAGPTRLFRRLSTAEAESEPDQVNLSESETSIHATTRHARVDAAVRAVPQAGNLAASQLDSHWRKGKAVETMDDVFAAW